MTMCQLIRTVSAFIGRLKNEQKSFTSNGNGIFFTGKLNTPGLTYFITKLGAYLLA